MYPAASASVTTEQASAFLREIAGRFLFSDEFGVGFLPRNPQISSCESGFVLNTTRPILQIATTSMYTLYSEDKKKAMKKMKSIMKQFLSFGTDRSDTFKHFYGFEDDNGSVEKGSAEILGLGPKDDPSQVGGNTHMFVKNLSVWEQFHYVIYA